MFRPAGTLFLAIVLASCGTAPVATTPAPTAAATTAVVPTATPTATATDPSPAGLPAGPTVAPVATAAPTSPNPTETASDGPTPIPLPQAIAPTGKPSPTPTLALTPPPTATPTSLASATPTTNGAVRPTVYTVHSADNYMHVQFDHAMRQSGAGAANALSAYLLDGAALPAGSTVICGSPSCDVVRIDMLQYLARGSAHTMTVRGVFSAEGAELSPDPTFTAFRTDTTPG